MKWNTTINPTGGITPVWFLFSVVVPVSYFSLPMIITVRETQDVVCERTANNDSATKSGLVFKH